MQEIANRTRASRRQFAQVDGVGQFELGAGGVVEKGAGAADGVLPLLEISLLPQRPQSVDLGVVQEEDGIARAGEGVAHVSANAWWRETIRGWEALEMR